MPAFAYKAKLLTGVITEGVVEALDQKAAIDQLRGQKMVPLEVAPAATPILEKLMAMSPFKPSVGARELVLFSRQLSMPLTGVPLPFISYGGSHILISFVLMGIAINIARQGVKNPSKQ
jgi:type II secretory pathway component PulF